MSAKNVLFIDSRVAGYETLIAGLDTETQWHLLDPQQDGIAQIERLLADASDLDAIQIISHGAPGTLYLGSTVLAGSNLPDHAQRLQSIGASLSTTGDLLLYGCNVAQGYEGQAFVNALAALTGADVAASEDVTGPAVLGGNSVLEQVVGKIDTLNMSMEGLSASLADDYANTTATTGAVAVGGQATGNIELVQDEDWFKVSLVAGTTYLFTLSGSDSGGGTLGAGSAEAYLRLYGPGGSYTGVTAYDGGAGGDPLMSYTPKVSGEHYLSVSDLRDVGTGTYTLKVSASTVADDYANTTATTGAVAVGGQATGNIELVQDEDWFKVSLVAGTTYLFTLSGSDSGGGTLGAGSAEAYLRLYGPGGSYTGVTAYDGGAGGDPLMSYTPKVSGEHYLSVSDLRDVGTGTYTLKVSASTVADDYANTTATTGAVAVGGQATGNIELVQDEDWFKVSLVAGTTYLFTLSGSDSGGGTLGAGSAEAYLRLYGPGGSYTGVTAYDGGAGGDPLMSYTPKVSGEHYLSVSDLRDVGTGTYTLKVTEPYANEVNKAPTGSVTITGTATQGRTLTAANTLADADGLGTINYQWKANGTAITGATASSYTLTQAEVGKTITVTASYTDGQGTAESKTSAATAAVVNVNDAPTGNVTITGTATQGQMLTVANTLTDADGLGTISYQWKANNTALIGATSTSYRLTQDEVGKVITVTASYVDGFGATESKTSAATAAVANVNDAPSGTVTISGVIAVGQKLTAANTLADMDGLGTISYQWKANGAAIGGATSASYTLTQAEVGKTITVTASYIDGQGTGETKTSAATVPVTVTGSTPVEGTPGNDTLAVPIGSAKVDAGAGIDTVLLPLFPNAFKLNSGQAGQAQGIYGRGHRLELNDVEYVQFVSSAFKTKLDLSDLVSGMAQEQLGLLTDLYLAFFGRAPDVNGLEYWQQQLLDSDLKAQGKSKDLTQMAKDFAWSEEAQKLFPLNANNRDFVQTVYQNCFGRDPDAGGWDYWTNKLNALGATDLSDRGAFVADVILGAYAPTSGESDRKLLTNKHNVAMYYVNQLAQMPGEGYDVAINALLAKLTQDSALQDKAEAVIDHAFANPVSLAGVMSNATLFDSLWV